MSGFPTQHKREIDALSPSMRERLVDQQCAREQIVLHASALTRIVEQFDSRSDDLAISTFDGLSVTYGELGRRVRRLAQTLVGCGVEAVSYTHLTLPTIYSV